MKTNRRFAIWPRVSPGRRRIAVYAFVSVLAAAAVLSMGARLILGQERGHEDGDHEEAGIIDSISPHCASVGAKVTITGRAFGAGNVRIAVGGVPAHVVTATGNTATFVVPAGVNLGPAKVTATNPGGHTGSIAFRVCDLLVPEAWSGEWKMTMTYRKVSNTGSVPGPDQITAPIRTGEHFGLATVTRMGNCTGSISDAHFEIRCSAETTNFICKLGNTVQLAADRHGETISGSGTWNTTVRGLCGPIENAARTIQMSGQRLSLNQDLFGPPTSLVRSFAPFGPLIDPPCNTSHDDDGSRHDSSHGSDAQDRRSGSGKDHEHEGGEGEPEGGQPCH